jgi:predicted nucleic acid-binding protein
VYLLDTNVISIGAPTATAAPPELVDWMDAHSPVLFLSVVSVVEIQSGIAKSRREGAARKANDMAAWLDMLLDLYGDRILPLDIGIAHMAGEISDRARALGRPTGFADIAIAATAAHRRLTVLTRNVKHFAPLGVPLHDPFGALPS